MPRSSSPKKCSVGVRSRSPDAVGRCYKKGTKIFKNTGYKTCNYPTGCSPKLKLGRGKASPKKKSRSYSPAKFYTFEGFPEVGKKNPGGKCLPMSSKQLKKGAKVNYCAFKPKGFIASNDYDEFDYQQKVETIEEMLYEAKQIFKEFNKTASILNSQK
jgi:hypothetical protein